jgi:hypothetical protein
MLHGVRSWNVDLLHDLFESSIIQNIMNIHIPQTRAADKWSWAPSPSGIFQ